MPELSARKAARRLNRDERTIRRWIQKGRLTARKSESGHWLIADNEVKKIEQTRRIDAPDLLSLDMRIQAIEQDLAELRAGLRARQSRRAPPRTNANGEELITHEELPAGSIKASKFAESHGVAAKTFRYHLLTGLKHERPAYLACLSEENPAEVERWLSPDQQVQVLEFWERYGVIHT